MVQGSVKNKRKRKKIFPNLEGVFVCVIVYLLCDPSHQAEYIINSSLSLLYTENSMVCEVI